MRPSHPPGPLRIIAFAALLVLTIGGLRSVDAAAALSTHASVPSVEWQWPLDDASLEHPFVAPAHDYAPGHRGIDLRSHGDDSVLSPADGVIAFAGAVAGRGVVTIDHGAGLVSTLEPISTELAAGTAVVRGQSIGAISVGGHVEPGHLHVGVRLAGVYINPQLLLGEVPRAVLLPCC